MYFTPPAMMLAFLLSKYMRELNVNEIDQVAGGPAPVVGVIIAVLTAPVSAPVAIVVGVAALVIIGGAVIASR